MLLEGLGLRREQARLMTSPHQSSPLELPPLGPCHPLSKSLAHCSFRPRGSRFRLFGSLFRSDSASFTRAQTLHTAHGPRGCHKDLNLDWLRAQSRPAGLQNSQDEGAKMPTLAGTAPSARFTNVFQFMTSFLYLKKLQHFALSILYLLPHVVALLFILYMVN